MGRHTSNAIATFVIGLTAALLLLPAACHAFAATLNFMGGH